MALNVTGPLLKDHAELRRLLGELKQSVDSFDLTGIRRAANSLRRATLPHTQKEEIGLYLLGQQVLRPDNAKLPELFEEHDTAMVNLSELIRCLYSPRLGQVEDQIRNLSYWLVDSMSEHMEDEEQTVWPALEKLMDDDLKQAVLDRYGKITSSDDYSLSRSPFLSLPLPSGAGGDDDPEVAAPPYTAVS